MVSFKRGKNRKKKNKKQTKLSGVFIETLDRALQLCQLCIKLVNLLQIRLQNLVCSVWSQTKKMNGCS